MAEFDIDNPPADLGDESPAARRRRERRGNDTKSKDSKPKPAADSKTETTLTGRLSGAFTKLADQRHAKGDEELAAALNDEAAAMSHGLVTLTRNVTFLRGPLVFGLELALVLLAFWRVGAILLIRALVVREQVTVNRAEYEGQPDTPFTPPADSVVNN